MQSNEIAIIIPARMGSTRLPGKPLIVVGEKTIIQWVYEKALQSKHAGKVIVATDDKRIYDAVKAFGGEVEMTSADHASGSDRIAEVARRHPEIKVVVNVQGDEPLIDPASIDSAVEALLSDEKADISTLIRVIPDEDEANNPNLVKVVVDKDKFALYFSRSVIPYPRNANQSVFYGHIGLYAYKIDSLLSITSLEQAGIERAESLEQLRALYNGMKIKCGLVNYVPVGIDTPEDLVAFENIVTGK